MYLSFYRLRRTPFHITPDPEFLFLSPSHREAFASVVYGVEERKGFITLTGEVGTGKTTILRSYLKEIEDTAIRPIYVFNPDMSFADLLQVILGELDVKVEGAPDTTKLLETLHAALIEQYRAGRNIVLIIDEAQHMPVETLEQLRMLSNLETAKDKLLQIALVGQPELENKLARHELRQLRQRIAVRATLQALKPEESLAYIQHRVTQAGGSYAYLFDAKAAKAVVRTADGNPRMLNILCDNALIAGYGLQQKPVGAALARQVIADLREKAEAPTSRVRLWIPAAGLLAVVLAVAFAAYQLRMDGPGTTTLRSAVHAVSEVAPMPPQLPPVGETDAPMPALLEPVGEPPSEPVVVAAAPMEDAAYPPDLAATTRYEPAVLSVERPEPSQPRMVVPGAERVDRPRPAASAVTRVVREGDCLIPLIKSVYGYYNDDLIEWVKASNPELDDEHRVFVGDTIVFPELSLSQAAAEPADTDTEHS